MGGIHITIDGINFLKENPEFSIGVVGESEETIVEIIDYIFGKKKLENIDGITYRKGNKIIQNKFRKLNENLDSFHFPNYTYFDSVQESKMHVKIYPILTSRSCPFKCSFCICSKALGEKWRARSVENVIEELIQAKHKYKTKKFSMVDDNWALDMKRAKEIKPNVLDTINPDPFWQRRLQIYGEAHAPHDISKIRRERLEGFLENTAYAAVAITAIYFIANACYQSGIFHFP